MNKPYVILIGSASGIGKSTLAAELAKKLKIKHLVESDFIREVIRGIIDEDYAPALHYSSYDAYKTLRGKTKFENEEELIAAGFEEHVSFVIPSIEKVISRAIEDYDNIILEGVHLVPGLLDLDKFKDKAEIYFFILTVDEQTHQERFVKRAIQLGRGGKQLDYFKENRIILDYLVKVANENEIPIINAESLEKATEKMKRTISNNCAELPLYYGIYKIPDVIDIVIRENNGSIKRIEYNLDGFDEPVVRKMNLTDEASANQYLIQLNTNPNMKDYLQNIINLTRTRKTTICASSMDELDKIINELTEKGFFKREII